MERGGLEVDDDLGGRLLLLGRHARRPDTGDREDGALHAVGRGFQDGEVVAEDPNDEVRAVVLAGAGRLVVRIGGHARREARVAP